MLMGQVFQTVSFAVFEGWRMVKMEMCKFGIQSPLRARLPDRRTLPIGSNRISWKQSHGGGETSETETEPYRLGQIGLVGNSETVDVPFTVVTELVANPTDWVKADVWVVECLSEIEQRLRVITRGI